MRIVAGWDAALPPPQETIANMSTTGFYFISHQPYDIGQQLLIQIDLGNADYIMARAIIVRSQPGKTHIAGYGGKFLQMGEEDTRKLGVHLTDAYRKSLADDPSMKRKRPE